MNESSILTEVLCRQRWEDRWADEIEPDRLLRLAYKNHVLIPLSRFVLERNIHKLFRDDSTVRRMKEALLLHDRDHTVWLETLHKTVSLLETEEIDVLLLKGLSYETGQPRDMGDLDLLVRPDKLKQSIDLLVSEGFVYRGGERGFHKQKGEPGDWDRLLSWSNQFEFYNEKTGLLIELHTAFFQRDRVYRFNPDPLLDRIEDFWSRRIFSDELGCFILSAEDRLLLLCMHNAVKRAAPNKTFALRNILDMRDFLSVKEIDWSLFLERAVETETLLFVLYSLETALLFFPDLLLNDVIEKGNRLLSPFRKRFKALMHSCFYNLETAYHFRAVLYDFCLPFAVKSRLKHKVASLLILPVLFPPPWRLRQIYGLPRHSPLFFLTYPLEPIRWIRIASRQRRAALGKI